MLSAIAVREDYSKPKFINVRLYFLCYDNRTFKEKILNFHLIKTFIRKKKQTIKIRYGLWMTLIDFIEYLCVYVLVILTT